MMLTFRKNMLLLNISLVISLAFYSSLDAAEKMPDDVRYMLEDMYGANKNDWPAVRTEQDLNNDGFSDWVIKKKNCTSEKNCKAEIFICLPDKTGKCAEYCYIEVKNMANMKDDISKMKCESTC